MSWSMTSVHEADVASTDVFRYYVDPTTWGDWGHNTKSGRPVGPVRPGATVEVRVASYPHTYHVKVREVEVGRYTRMLQDETRRLAELVGSEQRAVAP